MKHVALIFVSGLAAVGTAHAQDPQVLLQRYKCYICHADQETRTGPAYVDVAARYRGSPNAVSALAAVVRQGAHGAGPWHMPPHPEVSEADAKKMVRYILSLKK
jgi:cytochrome c